MKKQHDLEKDVIREDTVLVSSDCTVSFAADYKTI